MMIPVDVRQQEVKGELNHEAICVWVALGFMLDRDTFFKGHFWNRPQQTPWYYHPNGNSFNDTVDQFAELFETTVKNSIKGKDVLLALSGGLDSRTLAVALTRIGIDPFVYSYQFNN